MEHDAVAERLGAERVLADRLQHPAERRVHDAKQHEEGHGRYCEDEIVGQELAVGLHAEDRMVEPFEARLQNLWNLERAPVLAAGEPRELRGKNVEGVSDGERHHGEEDRLHAQREEADRQRQRQRQDEGEGEAPERSAAQLAPNAYSASPTP